MTKYAALHIRLADGDDRKLEANYGKISAPAAVVLAGIETSERVEDRTVRGLLDVSQAFETGPKNGGAIHYKFAFHSPGDLLEASTLEALVPADKAREAAQAIKDVPGVNAVYLLAQPKAPRSRTSTDPVFVSKAARNRAATLGLGTN